MVGDVVSLFWAAVAGAVLIAAGIVSGAEIIAEAIRGKGKEDE